MLSSAQAAVQGPGRTEAGWEDPILCVNLVSMCVYMCVYVFLLKLNIRFLAGISPILGRHARLTSGVAAAPTVTDSEFGHERSYITLLTLRPILVTVPTGEKL
jgi:hypothetical protein